MIIEQAKYLTLNSKLLIENRTPSTLVDEILLSSSLHSVLFRDLDTLKFQLAISTLALDGLAFNVQVLSIKRVLFIGASQSEPHTYIVYRDFF